MKAHALALLLAAVASAHAQSYDVDFDSLNPGDAANLAAPPLIRFDEASFSPDYDPDGDVIPGTDRWRVAYGAPDVLVQSPSLYDRGTAPSGLLALDGVFQPTLVRFSQPVSLTAFSVTLDNDSYGDPAARIEFYGTSGGGSTLLGWIPADQSQPGFTASLGTQLDGVDAVLLPSGALYDNLNLKVVPEPGTVALAALGAVLAVGWRRRASRRPAR